MAEIPNSTSGIAWEAGGKELVFASTSTPTLTPEHVWTVPVNGGKAVDRTPDLVGTASTVMSDPRGNVWVDVQRGVVGEVDRYRDEKLETAYRWPGGVVEAFPVFAMTASDSDVMAFNVGDPNHSTNVAVLLRGGELQKITHEGDDTLANVNLGDAKIVHWTAKDGTKLEGIATFPADYVAGQKYPFLVLPHGGPEANDSFQMDSFSRMVSGMGYVESCSRNIAGRPDMARIFSSRFTSTLAIAPNSDVDSATDFAIAQGWADPNRLAIFGWSAGGFHDLMLTVTQTHPAIKRQSKVLELPGLAELYSDQRYVAGGLRRAECRKKDPTPMVQFSAVMHVHQVTTPLLILHGEADVRVPTFQGREYYVLLAERGKTVRMVTYPGSPHFPRLAEQQRDVFKELGDWLKKYNP